MKHFIIAGTLLALSVPASSFAQDAKPAAAMNMSDLSASQYVEMAASSDMFEIESSKVAAQKAQSDDVKSFAGHMVSDHSATTKDLMAAAKAEGIEMPKAMMPKHMAMVEDLMATDAAGFDAAYIRAQTMAHEEAVALHTAYSKTGKDAALKAVAAKAVPIVTEHLGDVKAITAKI